MKIRNNIIQGDNLDILRKIDSETFNLIYIDPPFYSQQDYQDFNDNWDSIDDYLEFMKPRIKQIHRILKDNGSFYLHAAYHASHYLKVLCDEIFGYNNFINEIVWYYSNRWTTKSNRLSREHDIILSWSKSQDYIFNEIYVEKKPSSKERYNKEDEKGKFMIKSTGEKVYWKNNKRLAPDVWEIFFINSISPKRVGYRTQKPLELLERIIKMSSNEGDLIGDFFCGSGTTCVAAKKLRRNYFGCDINPKAIKITKNRIKNTHKFKNISNFVGKKVKPKKVKSRSLDSYSKSKEKGEIIE